MTIEKLECGTSKFSDVFNSVNGLIDNGASNKGSVVIFGDSITAQNTSVSGVTTSLSNTGYFVVANHLLNSKFSFVNSGVGGNTTAQILARIETDVIALNPRICIVLGGANDLIQGISPSTTIANLTSIYTSLFDAGITPLLCTVPSASTFSSENDWDEVNRFIINYALDNNTLIVDFASSMIDVNNTVFPYHPANSTADGIHPNKIGAILMGTTLASVLTQVVSSEYTPPASNSNSLNINGNTLLTGTGGNIEAGVAPDGWSHFVTGANAQVTWTGSVVDNGDSNSYVITQTNAGSATGGLSVTTTLSSGLVEGDVIQPYMELGISGGVGVETFEARIRIRNSGGTTLLESRALARTDATAIPLYTQEGKILFPKMTIPALAANFVFEVITTSVTGVITITKPSLLIGA